MVRPEWFYYLDEGDTRRGPFAVGKIGNFPLTPETLVWHDALPDWRALRDVPELWSAFAPGAVGAPAGAPAPAPPPIPPHGWHPPPSRAAGGNTPAVASLLVALLAVGWWCLPGWVFVSALLSLGAIGLAVFGLMRAHDAGGKGPAIAGLTVGLLNLVASGAMLLVIGLFVTADVRRTGQFPSAKPPPAVPATIPTMPRFDLRQPKFPTSLPTSRPADAPNR